MYYKIIYLFFKIIINKYYKWKIYSLKNMNLKMSLRIYNKWKICLTKKKNLKISLKKCCIDILNKIMIGSKKIKN